MVIGSLTLLPAIRASLLITAAALLFADSAAAAAFPHPQALSGAWFDPARSGEGFFVLVTDASTVVTYYGYDRNGARLWLVTDANASNPAPGESINFSVFQGSAGQFGLPLPQIERWGSLSLRFDDCRHAEFSLSGLDGSNLARAVLLAGVRDQPACDAMADPGDYLAFNQPEPVAISGYEGDAMEPFISRDGRYLFFNDTNEPGADTDIHYAQRIDDLHFAYRGRVAGVNSPALDGVPSMDRDGNFYFVSTRSYAQSLSTLYHGRFADGVVDSVGLVEGVSQQIPGQVNFDAEISGDGAALVFVDGFFNAGSSFPAAADLAIARRQGTRFERAPDSAALLAAVNTPDLEYAPCMSDNGLELFFSRHAQNQFAIYRSSRWRQDAAFEMPQRVRAIEGFVEAPTLSPDQRSLYFHRRVGARFVIHRVQR